MYDNIKKWYDMGLWSAAQVRQAVLKGVISEAQYKEIVGGGGKRMMIFKGAQPCNLRLSAVGAPEPTTASTSWGTMIKQCTPSRAARWGLRALCPKARAA